jgi:uncharacterized metal-binding protein
MSLSPEGVELAQIQKDKDLTLQQSGLEHDTQMSEEKQISADAEPIAFPCSNCVDLLSKLGNNAAWVLMGLVIAWIHVRGFEKDHNDTLKAYLQRTCNKSSVWR